MPSRMRTGVVSEPRWPLLDTLAADQRTALLASARRRTFRAGQVVFHADDPGDSLHLVVSGSVAVRVTTPLGDVVTLEVLTAGAAFGELALVRHTGRRTASVQALEPTETKAVSADVFARLRADHPGIDQALVELLADRSARLAGRLVEALYVPAPQRVLRRVHEMTKGRVPPVVLHGLTQADLAALAGTTRPTANRTLRTAQADGVLRLGRGTIEVVDAAALARRAG